MLNLFICAFKRTGGAGTVSLMAEAYFPAKGAVARCLYRITMVDLLASAILIYTFIASTLNRLRKFFWIKNCVKILIYV